MKIVNRICLAVIIVIVLAIVCINLFIKRIEIGEVGVRTRQYSILGKKGVEAKDFAPGWHRRIPLLDAWNVFDATVQTLEFASKQERARTRKWLALYSGPATTINRGEDRLKLKSDEGKDIELDITIKYRIMPGQAHQLYQKTASYRDLVQSETVDTLQSVFGQMSIDEFYNPSIRRQRTIEAEERLTSKFGSIYVELISILIRDISFDPAYERKILEKKLADQDVKVKESETKAAEKRGETNKIMAETQAAVHVIEQERQAKLLTMQANADRQVATIAAEAKVKVETLRADADLHAAKKVADGTLLEKIAEAEGERLKAQALKGSGGANLVALEAATNLRLQDMTLSTVDTDFLNIEEMVKKLGATR